MLKEIQSALSRRRVIFCDLLVIPIAWFGAYWLRYNLEHIPPEFLASALGTLPVVISVQAFINAFMGVHRGEWRFVSLPDLFSILKTTIVGVALIVLILFFVAHRLMYVPRSVFIFYGILLLLMMCGMRIAYRLFKDHHFSTMGGRRVIIVGSGNAGEQLLRDLKRNHPTRYSIIGFLDDDARKIGRQIHRVPIIASPDVLGQVIHRWDISLVLIAIPSATDVQMRRLVSLCEQSQVEFRTLPSTHELVSNHVNSGDLRAVRIEDLLGREPVKLDWQRIRKNLFGKTVLITGAGGSIGSELSLQLAAIPTIRLILFDQSEFNLYRIREELLERFPKCAITTVLGDVVDAISVQRVFLRFKPFIVFHAAAYKHVPMLEHQLRETLKNNVMGTKVIADLAVRNRVNKFVLISTDKAVNPLGLMGASKRMAEVYCQFLADTTDVTQFITVRFGNVLGSTGSVVPKFQQQIDRGGPVTVTHPKMTRYFMTATEAAQLILEASSTSMKERVYVLDMGKPVMIDDLARQLIRLSGKIPDEDIKIVYTGLRPGEKMVEELFHQGEDVIRTEYEKIYLAKTQKVVEDEVVRVFNALCRKLNQADDRDLLPLIFALVPEYRSDQTSRDVQASKVSGFRYQ